MSKVQERHLSGINFDWMFVREIRFADNPTAYNSERLGNLQVDLQLSSEISEDGERAKVRMGLTLRPPTDTRDLYQALSAKIEAGFSLREGEAEPSVSMEQFVRKQAPAILLPFLRQEIAEATAKSRFGQVMLPPINVSKLVDEIEKSQQEAAAGEEAAEPESARTDPS